MSIIRVVKSLFVETGTYNDMVMRPYQAHITPDLVQEFNEVSNTGLNLTAGAVAGVAGKILNPSTTPTGHAMIDNGWGERRMRFTIEFEIDSGAGRVNSREVITGYTDYSGGTMQGNVDPHMRCYFNNVLNMRVVREHVNGFVTNRTGVIEASHVLCKQAAEQNANVLDRNQRVTMRPEDVVGAMMMDTVIGDGNRVQSFDLRSSFLTGPKKSRRQNGLATRYVADIMNSLNQGHNTEDAYLNIGGAEPYEKARDNLREASMSGDQVLRLIGAHTSYNFEGYTTYGDLCRIFPDLDANTVLILRGSAQRTYREAVRGDAEGWGGSTMETVAANILSNAVPAIMMELMLAQVSFVATNRTLTGEITVTINGTRPFTEGMDMSPYLQQFVNRMQREVLLDVSKFNQIDFAVQMSIDLTGDTFMTISLNGEPDTDFITPSFCDALLTPVLSRGNDNLNQVAYNLNSLFNNARQTNGLEHAVIMGGTNLSDHVHTHQPYYQPQYTTAPGVTHEQVDPSVQGNPGKLGSYY